MHATISLDRALGRWGAGASYSDGEFTPLKNIAEDALLWDLVVQAHRLPSDRLASYIHNGSLEWRQTHHKDVLPPKVQREIRESARDQLQHEAADGRFLRWSQTPMLWDAITGYLLVGTNSVARLMLARQLFLKTFQADLFQPPLDDDLSQLPQVMTSGTLAEAVSPEATASVIPSHFGGGRRPESVAWSIAEGNIDFLGSDFLLWLWHSSTDGGLIRLGDESVFVSLSGGVVLEDPLGMTGTDTLKSEVPASLPEAFAALFAGKLPRKIGIHLDEFSLVLTDKLSFCGVKIPNPESDDLAYLDWRIAKIRELTQRVYQLYDWFLTIRLAAEPWRQAESRIREWVRRCAKAPKLRSSKEAS